MGSCNCRVVVNLKSIAQAADWVKKWILQSWDTISSPESSVLAFKDFQLTGLVVFSLENIDLYALLIIPGKQANGIS